jgi:antitoxin CptB
MVFNITDLKKKIIYRSTYRGTKEMDKLLSHFTKKFINEFNDSELICLANLLDLDDENLYNFNQGRKVSIKIEKNKVSELFKNYVYKNE